MTLSPYLRHLAVFLIHLLQVLVQGTTKSRASSGSHSSASEADSTKQENQNDIANNETALQRSPRSKTSGRSHSKAEGSVDPESSATGNSEEESSEESKSEKLAPAISPIQIRAFFSTISSYLWSPVAKTLYLCICLGSIGFGVGAAWLYFRITPPKPSTEICSRWPQAAEVFGFHAPPTSPCYLLFYLRLSVLRHRMCIAQSITDEARTLREYEELISSGKALDPVHCGVATSEYQRPKY